MKILQQGLKPTPKDDRDFTTGALTTLPKLSELESYLKFETLGVKDQKDSDFCSAFASCLVSELQEGVLLSPEYSFALSKILSGGVDEWGQDLRTAMKVHVKFGALPQSEAPFSLEDKDADFLRSLKNWPGDLIDKTTIYRKKSFLKVTGPYDHFDNIRATLHRFKNEKRAVVTGLIWSWPLDIKEIKEISDDGSGHAIGIVGYSPEGLIMQNSAGMDAGENGCHILSREVVNHFAESFGAYMFVDLSPSEVEFMLENNLKLEDNWLKKFIKFIWIQIWK